MGFLNDRVVPEIVESQVKMFTRESIRAKEVLKFDAVRVLKRLQELEGEEVVAFDTGESKIAGAKFGVSKGKLKLLGELKSLESKGGEGFLDFIRENLDKFGKTAKVGISAKSITVGTVLTPHPDVPKFNEDLQPFGGDLGNIIPGVTLLNDAISGLVSGAVEAGFEGFPDREVLYVINGGGVNGAVLQNETIFGLEGGHVEVANLLNPQKQAKSCDFLGQKFVCIERVASSGAGIEDLYMQKTGKQKSAKELADDLSIGDELVMDLYDNSAVVVAHMVMGLKEIFGLLKNLESTTIVFHGGAFKAPGYADRVVQILEKYLGFKFPYLVSHEYSKNSCLEGAAVAALAL